MENHIKNYLPTQLSREQAKQEPTHYAIGEEQDFALARRDPRIADDHEGLVQALRYVMMLVGVRAANLPTPEETSVLCSFIAEFYGGHTAAEIRLAFKMAVASKLGLSDDDLKHYENFSVQYFARIMNAYRKWASDVAAVQSKPADIPQTPKHQVECEYCYVKLAEIDRLPCKVIS